MSIKKKIFFKIGKIAMDSGIKINEILTGKNYYVTVSEVIDQFQLHIENINKEYNEQLIYTKDQYSKRLSELLTELRNYKQIKNSKEIFNTCANVEILFESQDNSQYLIHEVDPLDDIINN